jgi:hypothetical protein
MIRMSTFVTSPTSRKRKKPSLPTVPKKKPNFIQRSGKIQPKQLIPRKTITFDLNPTVYTLLKDNTYNKEVQMPKPVSLNDFFFKNKRNPGILELSEQNALSDVYIEHKIQTSRIDSTNTYETVIGFLINLLRSKVNSLDTGERHGTSIGDRFIREKGILERLIVRFEKYLKDNSPSTKSPPKHLDNVDNMIDYLIF